VANKSRHGRTNRSNRVVRSRPIRLRWRIMIAVAGIAEFSFQSCRAQTTDWNGGTGNWNVASNWSAGQIPTTLVTVNVLSGTATIGSSSTNPGDGAAEILLDGSSGNPGTVEMQSGSLTVDGNVAVSLNDYGEFVQDDYIPTATIEAFVVSGFGSGSAGNLTVNISAGGTVNELSNSNNEITDLSISGGGSLYSAGTGFTYVDQLSISGNGTLSLAGGLGSSVPSASLSVSAGLLQLGSGFGAYVFDISGSGLGLSQVLGFAKQSGGGIRIDSRQGEGTTVKVFLPRAQMDDGLETAHNSIPEAPAHRTPPPAPTQTAPCPTPIQTAAQPASDSPE